MLKRRTLFVVGAGASAEFKMPVGDKLAEIIARKMDIRFERFNNPNGEGDHQLFQQITHGYQQNANEMQQAAWRIRDGIALTRSIDDYLDIHRSDELANLLGKAAIVRSILEAERASTLYFNIGDRSFPDFDPKRNSGTWIASFFQIMNRGVSKEDVNELFGNASFIVFNYDRCVEFYLKNAVQKLYQVSADKAKALVNGLTILHPYGTLGETNFGQERVNFRSLAGGIQTYTEQLGSEVAEAIKAEVATADMIVFLGFAYHPQNMELLRPEAPSHASIIGSAYAMSEADIAVTAGQLNQWLGHKGLAPPDKFVRLKSLTCAELFSHFAKTIESEGQPTF